MTDSSLLTVPEPNCDMRAVLDELLNDPDFQAPDRHKRFLRYIVEETLAGRASRIKAYSVAVDVFGRPADFDSAIDSIVRTEATRLRAILSKYYENRAVPVQIRIPKGTYVPEFVETQQSSDVDEIHTHNLSGNDAPGCSATESKQASIDLAQVMDFRQPMLFVEQVEALTDDYATRVLARTLSQELLATLGQFEGVTLFRRPDGPMMSSLFAGVAARSIYLLATKVRIVCDKVYLWWHLSDPRSMEVISTATQWVALQSGSDVLIETAIAQRIALAIGGRRGLIKSLQVRLFLGRRPRATPAS